MLQDQGNHSGNPKVLTRDGIMGVLGDQTAESLSSSLAILKEPVLGPYTHTLLGTFVSQAFSECGCFLRMLLDFTDWLNF